MVMMMTMTMSPRPMEWSSCGSRRRCSDTGPPTTHWTSTTPTTTRACTCTSWLSLRTLVATDCPPLSVAWRNPLCPTPSLICVQVCMLHAHPPTSSYLPLHSDACPSGDQLSRSTLKSARLYITVANKRDKKVQVQVYWGWKSHPWRPPW